MISRLKNVIRKIILGYKFSSDSYIEYMRKKGAKIGENTFFFDSKNTTIDPVRLDWVEIGDNCKFASGFNLLAHDYSFSVLTHTHGVILQSGGDYTKIGNNVFAGINVTVLRGVTIGDNVIIGAQSVVTKDIPSNTVYGGNPARFLMTIEDYYQKKLETYNQDVVRNVKHIINLKGSVPSIEELEWYSLLFLERNKENLEEYILKIDYQGNSRKDIEKVFWSTQPSFRNYDTFIEAIRESHTSEILSNNKSNARP